MTEQLILVDEQDQELGQAAKLEVHQKALCHRAFSVFVFRKLSDELELLLQQRNPGKYHCGGLWTNTCCGHPRPGEATDVAAKRRLEEEMGLNLSLKPKGKFHYIAEFENGLTENEVDHVFVADYHEETIQPNPEEVSDFRWVTIDALQKDLKENPASYTPWFEQALSFALLLDRHPPA